MIKHLLNRLPHGKTELRILAVGLVFLAIIFAPAAKAFSQNIWEQVSNPKGAKRPWWVQAGKNGYLYSADLTTGFNVSTDFGRSWSSINGTGLVCPTGGFSIQEDPVTGYLFGASADTKAGNSTYYVSKDAGRTWVKMKGYSVGCCTNNGACFLPNGDILFGGFWPAIPKMDAYYSTDHGASCTRTASTADGGGSFCIGYNPVTRDCWMGSENGKNSNNNAVYRSTDSGRTWTPVITPVTAAQNDKFWDCMHITFSKSGDAVFIMCMTSVYRTKDRGASWEKVSNSGSRAGRGGWLATDPNGYIYAGDRTRIGHPVRRSEQNGDTGTWKDWYSGIPSKTGITTITYNPADGRMYCVSVDENVNPSVGQIYRTVSPVCKPENPGKTSGKQNPAVSNLSADL